MDFSAVTPKAGADPVALRAARAAAVRNQGLAKRPGIKAENRVASGAQSRVPVRIYWPEGPGPYPLLVYAHGGGWVLGDLDGVDDTCRALAELAQCVVVSVDYRLAPEHRFPAAVEDVFHAFRWAVREAASMNADPRMTAVGGDSAGGNLAAVVALRARDEGGPIPGAQVLVYPITDYNFQTRSYQENGDGYFLTREGMEWFWDQYLARPEDGQHPWASPLKAASLAGLPPAFVLTAEYDPLRDEGESYAARLQAEGVEVTSIRVDGLIHGFFTNAAWALPQREESLQRAAKFLRRVWTQKTREDA
ncbi:MAG: alpha/beta hydrolase [Kyrpidia sp.]|nr:alpha/beta hydrolase [Kyrpidia sp.]